MYQNVESIEQTGDMEVTVTTAIPDSQFNQGMGGAAGVIESAATLEALGLDYGNSTGGVNCTGPFQFEGWKAGETISMSAYDGYWDDSLAAKSKEFKFVFINDATARVNAMKSGEVDGGWMIPMDSVTQLRDSGAGDVLFGLNTSVSSLIVSNLEGPLGDKRVRQALLMALDRENMLQAIAGGIGEVTDVLTTPSVWNEAGSENKATAFDDIVSYNYDIEAAKKLVEEAGAVGAPITIATAPIGQDFTVTSQAAAAAAKAIGLDPTIETVTPNAYTAFFSDPSAREGVDLFYTVWYLSSPDPLEMYGVLRTDEFSNYANWSNAEYDSIITEAVSTMDPIERGALTAKAQQLTNEELPWLPLFEGPMGLFMGNKVTGVHPSIAFMYYPWAAELGAR